MSSNLERLICFVFFLFLLDYEFFWLENTVIFLRDRGAAMEINFDSSVFICATVRKFH